LWKEEFNVAPSFEKVATIGNISGVRGTHPHTSPKLEDRTDRKKTKRGNKKSSRTVALLTKVETEKKPRKKLLQREKQAV